MGKPRYTLEPGRILADIRHVQSWNNQDLRNIEEITPNEDMLRARKKFLTKLRKRVEGQADVVKVLREIAAIARRSSGDDAFANMLAIQRTAETTLAMLEDTGS